MINWKTKRFCTEWQKAFPDVDLLLISSWMEFWFIRAVPKYLNCSTPSKDLLKTHYSRQARSTRNMFLMRSTRNMFLMRGRNSSGSITTRHGLDGQEIESFWGRHFPPSSRQALRHGANYPPDPAPRLKKNCTSTPPLGLHGQCYGGPDPITSVCSHTLS
jgi:hypothetical protein